MAFWLGTVAFITFVSMAFSLSHLAHKWNDLSSDQRSVLLIVLCLDAAVFLVTLGMLLHYVRYIAPVMDLGK